MFQEIVHGVMQGVADHQRRKHRPEEFEHLRSTPFLHSSQYLTELTHKARNKYEYECILDHLYKHHGNGVDVLEIDSYATIEKSIVDKYWRG